jgi:hypothetical protein
MTNGNGPGVPKEIGVSYIKSSQFRVVSAQGAYGGFAPRGNFALTVFSERPAIPQESILQVDPTTKTATETITKTRAGIVRELEVCLMLDKQSLIELHKWIGQQIDVLKKLEEGGYVAR